VVDGPFCNLVGKGSRIRLAVISGVVDDLGVGLAISVAALGGDEG